jgi:hypothetical protein
LFFLCIANHELAFSGHLFAAALGVETPRYVKDVKCDGGKRLLSFGSVSAKQSCDSNQGRYADAELLYKRALVVSEKAFGPDDPHVAVLLNSLGVLFDNRDATRMFKPKEVGYRPPSFYAEPELREALKRGRDASDERVVESLYRKALTGDVAACCFWLKNRRPSEWRDVQHLDHAIGHYILSDRPMSEDEWIEQRTKLIDAKPQEAGAGVAGNTSTDTET